MNESFRTAGKNKRCRSGFWEDDRWVRYLSLKMKRDKNLHKPLTSDSRTEKGKSCFLLFRYVFSCTCVTSFFLTVPFNREGHRETEK